jgi:hypothetical protein
LPRQPGTPKTGGRKPGVANKRTEQVFEILARNKFNPIEEMIQLFHDSRSNPDTMGVAATCLKEISQYVYPKRKTIEHTGANGGPIEMAAVRPMSLAEAKKLIESDPLK